MALPTRKELPDYYQIIKHPVDIRKIRVRICHVIKCPHSVDHFSAVKKFFFLTRIFRTVKVVLILELPPWSKLWDTNTQLVKMTHFPYPFLPGAVLTLCIQVFYQYNKHSLEERGTAEIAPITTFPSFYKRQNTISFSKVPSSRLISSSVL